jgi:hypothetical protein
MPQKRDAFRTCSVSSARLCGAKLSRLLAVALLLLLSSSSEPAAEEEEDAAEIFPTRSHE